MRADRVPPSSTRWIHDAFCLPSALCVCQLGFPAPTHALWCGSCSPALDRALRMFSASQRRSTLHDARASLRGCCGTVTHIVTPHTHSLHAHRHPSVLVHVRQTSPFLFPPAGPSVGLSCASSLPSSSVICCCGSRVRSRCVSIHHRFEPSIHRPCRLVSLVCSCFVFTQSKQRSSGGALLGVDGNTHTHTHTHTHSARDRYCTTQADMSSISLVSSAMSRTS